MKKSFLNLAVLLAAAGVTLASCGGAAGDVRPSASYVNGSVSGESMIFYDVERINFHWWSILWNCRYLRCYPTAVGMIAA